MAYPFSYAPPDIESESESSPLLTAKPRSRMAPLDESAKFVAITLCCARVAMTHTPVKSANEITAPCAHRPAGKPAPDTLMCSQAKEPQSREAPETSITGVLHAFGRSSHCRVSDTNPSTSSPATFWFCAASSNVHNISSANRCRNAEGAGKPANDT